eukprot:g12598.t1
MIARTFLMRHFLSEGRSIRLKSFIPLLLAAVAFGRSQTALGQNVKSFTWHSSEVTGLAISPDGRQLASTSLKDDRVSRARPGKNDKQAVGTILGRLTGNRSHAVCYSPDGKRIAVSIFMSRDPASIERIAKAKGLSRRAALRLRIVQKITIHDATTFNIVQTILPHGDFDLLFPFRPTITSMAFSPDGRFLATGANVAKVGGRHGYPGGIVKIWETKTGKEIRRFEGLSHRVVSVAYSPDGKTLAAGTAGASGELPEPGELHLWDVKTGKPLHVLKVKVTIEAGSDPIAPSGIVFFPDGKQLAVAHSDGNVRLWNPSTGAIVRTLKGHTRGASCLAISSDGTRLASAGNDKTVRLWNANTGAAIATYSMEARRINAVVFTPDGKHLFAGGGDFLRSGLAPLAYEAGAAEIYDYSRIGEDPLRELILELGLSISPMEGRAIVFNDRFYNDPVALCDHLGPEASRAFEQFDQSASDWMSPTEYFKSDWSTLRTDPMAGERFDAVLARVSDATVRQCIQAFIHSDLATEPHLTNGTYGLQNYLMNDPAYMRLYSIDGGIEQLPRELARRIDADIRLEHRVEAVERSDNGTLQITTRQQNEPATHDFDFVIVALPHSALLGVDWRGADLDAAMKKHHAHYHYPAHYLRITILFERPFWRDVVKDSYFMMDTFGGCCLYDESSRNGSDGPGVLGWLLGGEPAETLSELSDEQLIEQMLDSLPSALRHGRDLALEGRVHRWIDSVNGMPSGFPVMNLDARHLPEPVRHPHLLVVGDYLFDSTLNGVLDSADFVAEWLAGEMEVAGDLSRADATAARMRSKPRRRVDIVDTSPIVDSGSPAMPDVNFLSQLTGSFAQPAAENPTVAMIEAAYKHHGLDWRYINCEVAPDDLADAVRGARAMGFAGFNLSIPHKVAVIEHLDGLGESAAIMRAVNCVVRRDGKYIGENTDGKGFLKSLREVVDPAGKTVVMLGAGGAARAIGVEVALAGAKSITVVNRSQERGRDLTALLNDSTHVEANFITWDGEFDVPPETDIVVNATSIGLYPDVDARPALNTATLKPRMVVADVIASPPLTNFVRDAREQGCTVIDGVGMLVNQGVIGLKYWTGIDADPSLIADTVKEEAAKHGYTVEIRDAEGKIEKQNDQVKEFISDGFDAIIICPRNSTAIGQVIQDANQAGIPVFTIDTVCEDKKAKVAFHVGTDNEQGGHVAGKAMIDALKPRGGGDVAILQFQRVDSCIDRVKGFTAEIEAYNKKAADKINIVGHYECEGDEQKGQEATREALIAHQNLVGIFAINDPAALGAVAALEGEKKQNDIVVVGFDGQPEALQAVKAGKLFDTPVQFPKKMAVECVKALVKYFDGDEVEPTMLIPTTQYRKEDAMKDPTLIKAIGGAHLLDAGEILVNGVPRVISSPAHARALGIAIIHQEFNLVPALSARENIFLGQERTLAGFLSAREERRRAVELFDRLGVAIDPDALIKDLSIAAQQIVEIARSLVREANLIVMDEPSATLSNEEVDRLFQVVRELKSQGIGVIYISHRLEEIFEIADRVTVLRDGERVATCAVDEVNHDRLVEMMVGRTIEQEFPPRSVDRGEPMLQVDRLSRAPAVHDASFTVHEGEVLAITGLVGAGRTELARLIFGADRADSGTVSLRGRQLNLSSPRAAIAAGICLLTEDRKSQGLIPSHSVRDNFGLPNLNRFSRFGLITSQRERKELDSYIDRLRIKLADPMQPAAHLSGGNQQKVVLAKWLARRCDVIIFDEPTRGIDVGGKYEIYELINELAARGKAIVLISSELPEVLGMADRADYGMVFVLLLLCAFFSVATYQQQSPTGADAGRQLADAIHKAHPDGVRVVILTGMKQEAQAFSTELQERLNSRGHTVVGIIQGGPPEMRQGLEEIDQSEDKVDVIACSQRTGRFSFLEQRAEKLPGYADADLMVPASFWWPSFLQVGNLRAVANRIAVIAIIAIGMTLVIISAGIDLSVGSLIALSSVTAALLIREIAGAEQATAVGMTLCCLAAIALCALLGVFSGTLVAMFKIPAFIVTLAMMQIASGCAYLLSESQTIYQLPDSFTWFGRDSFLGVPNPVFLMLALFVVAHVVMTRTVFGRYVYAVGGNAEAARLSGVPIRSITLSCYVICGALAGLGGVIRASELKSGAPTFGQMAELEVIAAVVVGGTSLAGGEGKILGTLIGALIIAVMRNGMNLTNVESNLQNVVLGLVIIGAIMLDKAKTWQSTHSKPTTTPKP